MITYQRTTLQGERIRDGFPSWLLVTDAHKLVRELQKFSVTLPPGAREWLETAKPGDKAMFYNSEHNEITLLEST